MKKYLLLYHLWNAKDIFPEEHAIRIIESSEEHLLEEIKKATDDVNKKERTAGQKHFLLHQVVSL